MWCFERLPQPLSKVLGFNAVKGKMYANHYFLSNWLKILVKPMLTINCNVPLLLLFSPSAETAINVSFKFSSMSP